MNRVAALPAEQRNELFSLTAERMGMGSVAVVEKDFWVCWTLKRLFEDPELSKLLIFKGGTSLSKVFGLIDRFSEDIDLILDWRVVTDEDPLKAPSKSKQRKLNEKMNESAREYIAGDLFAMLNEVLGDHCEIEVNAGEKDLGHIVRVKYPETSDAGNLLPYIQLEIGPLASWLPHGEHTVHPYVAEEFPGQFDDPACPVRAIDAERTFWEKATILHAEAHRKPTSMVPLRYSRHYYDLYLMAQADVKATALDDLALLQDVVEFKKRFYASGWANYGEAKPGSLKLVPPGRILDAMRKDYVAMGDMIFDRHPSFDEIVAGLAMLETEINAL
ncbi:nucleotidyl transferase AbiEii/AbiGii toxin family protein [Verrucomicrobiota bacterium]